MPLGQRIRELRLRRGMTQELLAEQMDVSRQAVTKWESGQSSPSTENLLMLARLFGVSAWELLGEPAPAEKKKNRLLSVCTAGSLILIVLCIINLFRLFSGPPANAIGFADGPTNLYLRTGVVDYLPLYLLTALCVGLTLWLTLRGRGKRGKQK